MVFSSARRERLALLRAGSDWRCIEHQRHLWFEVNNSF
jgi:hypothetical protein